MMNLRPSTAALLTAALTALAAAPANAFDKGHGGGILADLPANAPPGECYAKVRYENTSLMDGVLYVRSEIYYDVDGSRRFFGLG